MSTPKSRTQLARELETEVRLGGNLNILLVNAIASHVGLSAAEFECLSMVQDDGPLTAGELARRCGITTGGMTGMLDRLERMGFAKRTIDPNDRRRVLISYVPNKHAMEKVTALYAPLQKTYDQLVETYTEEQLAFLLAHATHMNKLLRMTTEHVHASK